MINQIEIPLPGEEISKFNDLRKIFIEKYINEPRKVLDEQVYPIYTRVGVLVKEWLDWYVEIGLAREEDAKIKLQLERPDLFNTYTGLQELTNNTEQYIIENEKFVQQTTKELDLIPVRQIFERGEFAKTLFDSYAKKMTPVEVTTAEIPIFALVVKSFKIDKNALKFVEKVLKYSRPATQVKATGRAKLIPYLIVSGVAIAGIVYTLFSKDPDKEKAKITGEIGSVLTKTYKELAELEMIERKELSKQKMIRLEELAKFQSKKVEIPPENKEETVKIDKSIEDTKQAINTIDNLIGASNRHSQTTAEVYGKIAGEMEGKGFLEKLFGKDQAKIITYGGLAIIGIVLLPTIVGGIKGGITELKKKKE